MRPSTVPSFDHGAALRAPAAHDRRGWEIVRAWLGDCGAPSDIAGAVGVLTPDGWMLAYPGDWIILSSGGQFHVAPRPRVDG
jgi:hypothetical protein